MASIIDTGLTLAAGINAQFNQVFAVERGRAFITEFATYIQSSSQVELFRFMGTVPAMRLMGHGRESKAIRSEQYMVKNQEYELTIAVDRNEREDDQTGQIGLKVQEMATRAAQHPDDLMAQVLILGGTTDPTGTDYNGAVPVALGYDGLSLFNTAHVSGASGNQSNDLSTTITDTSTYLGTVAEWRDIIRKMMQQLMSFKDDQGYPAWSGRMDSLKLLVHPFNFFAAREAATAAILAQTSNTTANMVEVVPYQWLVTHALKIGSGNEPYGYSYLVDTGAAVKPIIHQMRTPLQFQALEEGSEHTFKTGEFLYGVRGRYAVAPGKWQTIVRHRNASDI